MRYPATHKQHTRGRLLDAARRLFKLDGYRGVGVDAIMAAEGLTAGGFYAHFASKEALLAETFTPALARTREVLLDPLEPDGGADWLRAAVHRYLSRAHRDDVAEGCPMPALGAEVARADDAVRVEFQHYFEALVGDCERKLGADPAAARDQVLATLALCVGGLLLARAVPEPALSDRILRACRRHAPQADA